MEYTLVGAWVSLVVAIFATGVLIETALIRSRPVLEQRKTALLLNCLFVIGLLELLVLTSVAAEPLGGIIAVAFGVVAWIVGSRVVHSRDGSGE